MDEVRSNASPNNATGVDSNFFEVLEQYWGEVGLGPLGSFVGYVCLLGICVVFFALYSSSVAGRVLAFLFNLFVGRQHGVRVEVGALRVTLTAVFLENVQCTTANGMIRSSCVIAFRPS